MNVSELTTAEKISLARKRSGKSQAIVAALSGISGNTLGRIESGEVSPRVEQVELIAKALGMSCTLTLMPLVP